MTKANVQVRSISEIANEIRKDWNVNTHYSARPYLLAMYSLNSINDMYICDSARDIVARFLGNANTWKGDTARRVKKELNAMLKQR